MQRLYQSPPRKAADDMADPIAIMLKYLNVLGNISTKNNKTLVVPIPKVKQQLLHLTLYSVN